MGPLNPGLIRYLFRVCSIFSVLTGTIIYSLFYCHIGRDLIES